jgi:hypothetical protein
MERQKRAMKKEPLPRIFCLCNEVAESVIMIFRLVVKHAVTKAF